MIEFKIGDRYVDHVECDSFTVTHVNKKEDDVEVLYDNGDHGYIANKEGEVNFSISILHSTELTKL